MNTTKKSNDTKIIYVRVSYKDKEWLRNYCFKNRITEADVVREALKLFKDNAEATP